MSFCQYLVNIKSIKVKTCNFCQGRGEREYSELENNEIVTEWGKCNICNGKRVIKDGNK